MLPNGAPHDKHWLATTDMERDVLQFLQNSPGQLFSPKQVGKKLDRKQFVENANWARPVLQRLADQGFIRKREDGLFFYPAERAKS